MASATSANDNKRGWSGAGCRSCASRRCFGAFFALGLHRFLTFETLRANRAELLACVAARPAAAALIYLLVYTVVAAFSLPIAALVSVTGGFLFGTVFGGLLRRGRQRFGASILFLAARTAFRDLLRAKAGSAIRKMEDGFRRTHSLSARAAAGPPVSVLPGQPGARLLRHAACAVFVLATLIGITPGTFVYASVGNGLGAVFDAGKTPDLGIIFTAPILLPILGLALLAVVPVALQAVQRGRHERASRRRHLRHRCGLGRALGRRRRGAAGRANVVLIERAQMGGDCLNTGCVPSKSLLAAAQRRDRDGGAERFGVRAGAPAVDYTALREHVRGVIAAIAPHDFGRALRAASASR